MSARIDLCADLCQVQVHCMGVGIGHDQPRAFALGRTDRPEDIGPLGALVFGRRRPGAALGPAPGDLVLLPDARFILPPQLNLYILAKSRLDFRQLAGEAFLKSSTTYSF